MLILSIETSCDETAAAVTQSETAGLTLLSNIVSSQVALHAEWGGVVPNLAAREHLKNILPVIEKALSDAQVTPKDIDLIAVTNGPGLIPALLIGVGAAKTLSYLWNVPLIGVNHIEGHIYANFISDKILDSKLPKSQKLKAKSSDVRFPALCLVVSGGHTQLVLMKKHLDYEIVGETQDDAAGEAFDKVARILDLGYPGGPIIARRAMELKGKSSKLKVKFPRPMLNSKDFNFSFSGLKTAVLYAVKKDPDYKLLLTDYCYEFQQAAIDVLIAKTIAAARKYEAETILLAGGVSANLELRRQLGEAIKKDMPNALYNLPATIYTGDNAAMIGAAAAYRWVNMTEKDKQELSDNWKNLETSANLKLKN